MKKIFLILLLCSSISFVITAQSPKTPLTSPAGPTLSVKAGKYFIKTDGTRVDLHPTKVDALNQIPVILTNEKLEYYDAGGKGRVIHQSDVQEMFIGNDYYTLLPITKKYNRLLKVIATNNDHILSIYDPMSDALQDASPEVYLYVHNKQTREMEEDKVRYLDLETNYEAILPTIKKYFPDCSELFAKMDANSKKQKNEKKLKRKGPFENISNMNCSQ